MVLAELTVLAPNGVEEERGPGYVEYAIYGGEGELPELGEIEAATGEGLVEVTATEVPDDWADRWQDFHKPLLVGGRLWLRPSWEEPREGSIDLVVDPGRAFGTGAHPTTRLCLELLLELAEAGEAGGPLTDLGTGSGVLAIAAAKLGWAPVRGYDHEGPALEAAAANAEANGVAVELEHVNLRERLPALAPTTVANLTAPILLSVAAQLGAGQPRPRDDRSALGRPASLQSSTRSPRPSPPPASARPTAASRATGPRCCCVAPERFLPPGRISFAPMLATITGYSVGLFIHILAVVLAFGPTFGYALFFSVAPQFPKATPGLMAGVQKTDRYLVNPGMIVVLLAGIYLLAEGPWKGSEAFIAVGFVAILALFGLQHGFFQPQVRKAKELAERDLQSGDALSEEFLAVSQRIGQVGTLAGLIVAIAIFFMVVKP